MVIGTLWPPPTSHPASSWISPLRLIPFVTVDVGHRPDEISPVPRLLSQHPRSPYAEGSSRLHIQVLRRFHGLHWRQQLGSLFSPFPGTFSTLQRFTLSWRAAALLPFLRGYNASAQPVIRLHRLPATWHLSVPRPDFHRLAHDDFQTHYASMRLFIADASVLCPCFQLVGVADIPSPTPSFSP